MLNLVFDYELWQEGIYHYCQWDYKKVPHMLVFGSTGSGKTYLVRTVLARVGLKIPDASTILCDYKADDFSFLRGAPNHFEFTQCSDGLDRFYNEFLRRQSGEDNSRSFKLLMFDEWASYLNMLEKKEADSARAKLSTLLMLGRSFNVHVLISQQRADAEYFSKARDNFGLIIGLGNLSRESAAMFNFDRDEMTAVSGMGCGYMMTNGTNMKAIRVPAVRDIAKIEKFIRKTVSQ
ncbi:DNA segregation ATPase FtsK/SpoIIIE-like protein [Paenibacillus sp. DS2015]|uniref:type IV secretory system conjugative DNA transfer family protein n=1 Tax=Paenibacillus sp. DS2015 TaxID=3373917 RepID=UPI003D1C365F